MYKKLINGIEGCLKMNSQKLTFTFPSSNGKDTIYGVIWTPLTPPKAVLQITHGMCEYIERYEEFAQFLNGYGVIVCGHDHLGHGKRWISVSFKRCTPMLFKDERTLSRPSLFPIRA